MMKKVFLIAVILSLGMPALASDETARAPRLELSLPDAPEKAAPAVEKIAPPVEKAVPVVVEKQDPPAAGRVARPAQVQDRDRAVRLELSAERP